MSNGSPQFILTKYLRVVADVAGLNHVLIHLFQNRFSSVFSGSGPFFFLVLETSRTGPVSVLPKKAKKPDRTGL